MLPGYTYFWTPLFHQNRINPKQNVLVAGRRLTALLPRPLLPPVASKIVYVRIFDLMPKCRRINMF